MLSHLTARYVLVMTTKREHFWSLESSKIPHHQLMEGGARPEIKDLSKMSDGTRLKKQDTSTQAQDLYSEQITF
jgi:hypothetical protein